MISLLQRTNLHVTVVCQAIHTKVGLASLLQSSDSLLTPLLFSKNARHMLLDLITYVDPTLVVCGSRGLGKLKGGWSNLCRDLLLSR